MTGFMHEMTEAKRERLKKLTDEDLPTRIIAERLGIHQSQVYYYQKRLGIWKGKKRGKR